MSEHQPLFQFGTPLRDTDPGYAVLRLDSNEDIEKAIVIINRANEVLTPLVEGFVDSLTRALQGQGGQLVGQLQAAGLNPVPVAGPYMAPEAAQSLGVQPYQAPAQPLQTQVVPQQPNQQVYQPQAQASQAYAPPQQQPGQLPPGAIVVSGACWADTRHDANCKDCGGPTYLTVVTMRGDRALNAHQCATDASHKKTWCMTPIWESRKATALGKGIQIPDGLIFG